MSSQRPTVFGRLPGSERAYLADILRQETVGGALLLVAAALGIAAANSALSDAYLDLSKFTFGPESLHLHLTVSHWASDGLLAIFFFVAGVELKRELVVGSLRDPRQAALPIVAAIAGMAVPALIFVIIAFNSDGALRGWAVPTATDIAFALAVLAVVGSHLPPAMRAFLLTLAVVDDMGAITVIAVFYTEAVELIPLAVALALLGLWWYLQRRRFDAWPVYLALAVTTWGFLHASGVHATVAGVLLGLLTSVRALPGQHSPAERYEHAVRPWSAGIAVPVFAFFAAGVPFDPDSFMAVFSDAAAIGVVAGLFFGKLIGVFGSSWLMVRFTPSEMDRRMNWWDMAGLAVLSGIGFTVSLLIAELAFAADPDRLDRVKAGVLIGSLIAATVAVLILRSRDRVYRLLEAEEKAAEVELPHPDDVR